MSIPIAPPERTEKHDQASTLGTSLRFAAAGLVWGSSFLFMKVALDGVSFGQVAWSRAVLGALTLVVIFALSRRRLPRQPIVWAHFAVLSLFFAVFPYLLFAWAEQFVSSGLASIYNATTPIMTAVFATLVFRVEKLTRAQILGITLGIFGVLVIISPWQAGDIRGSLLGQLACLGAASCYGIAMSYQRRFVTPYRVAGVTSATLTIGIAAAIFLILTPLVAIGPVTLTLPVVASLLALGILGTGVAYVWNYRVLAEWGPTRTSTVTYITPVIGVILGFIVLKETLSWHEPVGAVLVILGVLLTQGRLRLPARKVDPI
ncbi:drug/metabolite transporter (DMT)-like permease [Rhodoglobus vestalii]|uniref:Drug/metabolite transporter (DMT)-like permease n=1 Tax=Rhodoglobus vestalii TaxID=193384 RepID=A0A8H2PYX7_9MICO|nr:DMT family transporter [Rhodoglobus vestalii]TQO20168.1 drug/metabolite transporter (DMT)-like permease [Rhodoglobus vestalii]